ncbi:MAG: PEP-CTERM sorting domain-containing protein [Chthoniobacterales bacterium]
MKLKYTLMTVLAFAGFTLSSQAANIIIDGDFSDWAGVPIAYSDPNESLAHDISTIQITHNDTHVFFRVSYFSSINPNSGSGLYLAIDNDSNPATGFDIFGLGLIGSEGGYQNDFPFQQATGVFNTGATTDAAIAISPYAVSTVSQEFGVARDAIIDTTNGDLLFPNASFNFAAYFTDNGSDFAGVVSYTIPEPSSTMLIGGGLFALIFSARRKKIC